MNIFYLHPDPKIAAQMQCDKHVVKMILESAQMLCTAHRELDDDGVPKNFYNKAHLNHPSTIWTRSSAANYSWLYDHFLGLCDEYTYRYGKIHMSDLKLRDALGWLPRNIRTGEFNEPPQCMPDQYKVEGDSIAAYRNYYKGDKARFAEWNKSRPAPEWW